MHYGIDDIYIYVYINVFFYGHMLPMIHWSPNINTTKNNFALGFNLFCLD